MPRTAARLAAGLHPGPGKREDRGRGFPLPVPSPGGHGRKERGPLSLKAGQDVVTSRYDPVTLGPPALGQELVGSIQHCEGNAVTTALALGRVGGPGRN